MKQTVDAIITLPVKAIFKAAHVDYVDFFEITRLVCWLIIA